MKMMTLHCTACGEDWQRPAQRGRPPKVCPDCKGQTAPAKPRKPKAAKPKPTPKPAKSKPKARDGERLEPSSEPEPSGTQYFVIESSMGKMVTTNEAYARKRNAGQSYCCAGTKHLGYLCEREQRTEGITCTCKCHMEVLEDAS